MKKYFIIFLSIFILFSLNLNIVFATTSGPVGFIPGQIWYSKTPLVDGDNVKIHTVVWNGGSQSTSVHVDFYDQNVILGSRVVTVLPSGLQDVYISWKVTTGDHNISAKITSSTITTGGTIKQITPSISTTSVDHQFVKVSLDNIVPGDFSSADIIKNEISKATDNINNLVPSSVPSVISDSASSIDKFRVDLNKSILDSKDQTQKTIDLLNNKSSSVSKDTQNKKLLDATEKPIDSIKIFFLTIASFIVGNNIVFYGICIIIVLIILRTIFRILRNI